MSGTVTSPDAYLQKSASAGRMGKAAELLVAATAIISTRGQLNVATAILDDDGIDLIFSSKGHPENLSVQVKTRFSDSTRPAGWPSGVKTSQQRPEAYRLPTPLLASRVGSRTQGGRPRGLGAVGPGR